MRKILLFVFSFGTLLSYSQDGTLDTSFGTGGKVVSPINGDERANALVIQPDGKIVVAGYTYSSVYGNDIACLRYNTNGTLDATFGTNGVATLDLQLGSDDKAMAIDIQSDGKLVVAGYSDNGSNKDAAVIRLNTNGTLDTAFGTDGKILTNYSTSGQPTREDEYWVVKIHGLTGNIVVGGTTYSASNSSRAIVARYTPAGVLDTSFATGGKYTSLPNSQTISDYLFTIEDLAIKPNGKITVVGWSSDWLYLGRLNADGTMDTTFSTDGYNHLWGGSMYAVALNNDDSFYFTGDIWTSPQTEVYTGHIEADGGGLTASHYNFGANMTASTLALEKDNSGRLVVGGYLLNNDSGHASFLVGRLLANHTIDETFGNGGFVTTAFANPVSAAFDMKIQADQKIVLAGFSGNNIALARYNVGVLSTGSVVNGGHLEIYPNPAKDFITLNIEAAAENTEYVIVDINGRIIKAGTLLPNGDNKINVESLAQGVYVLKVGNNSTYAKFIKE